MLMLHKKSISDYKNSSLFRTRKIITAHQNNKVIIQGKKYLSFITNDYLGLSTHEDVIKAFQNAANQYGVGSQASALLGGYTKEHQALEEELADFLDKPRVLLFPSGYMANLAVLTTLLQKEDFLVLDKNNHASMVDGALLSGVKFKRYQHNNLKHLTEILKKHVNISQANIHNENDNENDNDNNNDKATTWVFSDGVFSMDGDLAELPLLLPITKHYQAKFILDDAHGFGAIGKEGKGSLNVLGINADKVDIIIGTLSKAFGCLGAFVASGNDMIEKLIQFARPYIYTTALSPAIISAARASLKILRQEEWRREKIQMLIQYFQQNISSCHLNIIRSNTPIQAILQKNSKVVLEFERLLQSQGIVVGAIRPPTVAFGQERLRIILNAKHECKDIDFLLEKLAWAEQFIMKSLEKDEI